MSVSPAAAARVARHCFYTDPATCAARRSPEPTILKPTDAIIRLSATCICGSDLWPFRGLNDVSAPMNMGHEYCGIVEEVGSEVTTVQPGQFVVGSFCLSDNTCPHCRFGFQSSCEQREFMTGAQAPRSMRPRGGMHGRCPPP